MGNAKNSKPGKQLVNTIDLGSRVVESGRSFEGLSLRGKPIGCLFDVEQFCCSRVHQKRSVKASVDGVETLAEGVAAALERGQ